MSVERPVFMYLGSKWRIAPWIISHFPAHDFYIEPFGGSAAVLLRKSPAPMGEVYNDKYGRALNVFRVLRDPQLARRLMRMLRFTPYSHEEFLAARVEADGIVEDARRMLVAGLQGFGSTTAAGGKKQAGWRRDTRIDDGRNKRNTPSIWLDTWRHVTEWADRLRGVYLENEEAVDVIRRWDSQRALFYCDPPYVHTTRPSTAGRGYCHEMSDDQHRELSGVLRACKGMVVLSGYDCPLYRELYSDWTCAQKAARANNSREPRMETLWLNAAACGGIGCEPKQLKLEIS
jgi:DNA adenine methylase